VNIPLTANQIVNGQVVGMENIGARLRSARRKKELTQGELGIASGTNQAVIQKIENGKSVRPRGILVIAEILDVNPAWLQFGPEWAGRERTRA